MCLVSVFKKQKDKAIDEISSKNINPQNSQGYFYTDEIIIVRKVMQYKKYR